MYFYRVMNLRDTLLAEHSKAQADKIVQWIGSSQQRFDQLFTFFTSDEDKIVQRAAWPLSYAVAAHPALIQKHFSKLLRHLEKPGLHDAVKRNSVRLLQEIDIPQKYQGPVMNLCFDYIISPKEKPAVKAFSLTVLQNLSRRYPEIKNELRTIIETQWDNESPAFRSRARKILKELK